MMQNAPEAAGVVSLREAAELLDIHYMTAYRYVRTGRLPATLVEGTWRVRRADLAAAHRPPVAGASSTLPRRPGRPTVERLVRRLVAGDEPGAWRVVEDALVSGATPVAVHLELIAPAMRTVGERWGTGELSVGDEHRASAVCLRIVGRLGPHFARRGRRRGSVVLAGVDGDPHSLPVALAADVVRAGGWSVIDLGASVPAPDVVAAAAGADRLVAVALSATTDGHDAALGDTVAAVRAALAGVPVLVGGRAVDALLAVAVAADGWAPDAAGLVDRLGDLPAAQVPVSAP